MLTALFETLAKFNLSSHTLKTASTAVTGDVIRLFAHMS